MRDVGNQPPLSLHRGVDARQHPVHGRGQATDLVASTVVGDPEVELVVADGIDLCADVVEPRQGSAQDQPDHEGERHQDQWATHHQGSPQSVRRLVHGLEAGADDNRHLAVGRLAVLDPDPVGLGLLVVRGADGAPLTFAHCRDRRSEPCPRCWPTRPGRCRRQRSPAPRRRRSRCAAPTAARRVPAWSSRSRDRDRDSSSLLSVRCLSRVCTTRTPATASTAAHSSVASTVALARTVSVGISLVRHQPVADQPHGLEAGAAERQVDPAIRDGAALPPLNNDYVLLTLERGLAAADVIVEGEYRAGHQEQLYIETNGVVAVPENGGSRCMARFSVPTTFTARSPCCSVSRGEGAGRPDRDGRRLRRQGGVPVDDRGTCRTGGDEVGPSGEARVRPRRGHAGDDEAPSRDRPSSHRREEGRPAHGHGHRRRARRRRLRNAERRCAVARNHSRSGPYRCDHIRIQGPRDDDQHAAERRVPRLRRAADAVRGRSRTWTHRRSRSASIRCGSASSMRSRPGDTTATGRRSARTPARCRCCARR